MEKKYIKETSIPGLLLIERPTNWDERGFFQETVRLTDLDGVGIAFNIKQINHSFSRPRVIRALHAEKWNKIIFPVTGEMFSAIVDIRPESSTFGKVETFTFSEDNPKALFIPQGLANSICVLHEKPVHYIYLVDRYYEKPGRAIAWDDPDIGISWPVQNPIISERDKNNPKLRDLFPEKFK